MYRYDEFDHDFVNARVAEFSDQVDRRLAGEITEDQFRPLRLMNGVYLQLHAYMLRVAIPYGTLNSKQLRMLGHIARKYDKGYGHFTTRQNIQYNWPALSDMPAILADLASVEMHAIQTSGNCIRNVTADHFAGAAADEVADPRPYAEILRQWSSVHPEFSYLPRKFKIAVTGAERDRAAIQVHDIGLHLKTQRQGRAGLCRLCRRRAGPHADDRQEDPRLPAGGAPALLHHGDHARVQSLWPPRQQVQGAHQDPRARDRRRGVRPPGRGRMGGAEGQRAEAARGRHPRHRRLFRAAGAGRAAGRRRGGHGLPGSIPGALANGSTRTS